MWKLNTEDLAARDLEFQLSDRFPVEPPLDPEWAARHPFKNIPGCKVYGSDYLPGYRTDVVAHARRRLVESYPPDGGPLDVESLEQSLNRVIDTILNPPKEPIATVRDDNVKALWDMKQRERAGRERLAQQLKAKRLGQHLPKLIRDDHGTPLQGPPQPLELVQYNAMAANRKVPFAMMHDGTQWFIECHDGQVRDCKAAVKWLAAESDAKRRARLEEMLDGSRDVVSLAAQQRNAEWLRQMAAGRKA